MASDIGYSPNTVCNVPLEMNPEEKGREGLRNNIGIIQQCDA